MKAGRRVQTGFIAVFCIAIIVSYITQFIPGKAVGGNFFAFSKDMVKIVPCAFLLICLFEVWVKRETVEAHFGSRAGFRGFINAILLGSTTIGGAYVSFPVAAALYGKGARLDVIFTYVGAAAICRIPMTLFEASFVGLKFSLIRLGVSIPLVILSSLILGRYLEGQNYRMVNGK